MSADLLPKGTVAWWGGRKSKTSCKILRSNRRGILNPQNGQKYSYLIESRNGSWYHVNRHEISLCDDLREIISWQSDAEPLAKWTRLKKGTIVEWSCGGRKTRFGTIVKYGRDGLGPHYLICTGSRLSLALIDVRSVRLCRDPLRLRQAGIWFELFTKAKAEGMWEWL